MSKAVTRVRADTEAVPVISTPVNWVDAPWKSQRPVTASFSDKEAGPPAPQSRRIVVSGELKDTLK